LETRSVNGSQDPSDELESKDMKRHPFEETTWSAFVTYRNEQQTVRIISVRRARSKEEAQYLAD